MTICTTEEWAWVWKRKRNTLEDGDDILGMLSTSVEVVHLCEYSEKGACITNVFHFILCSCFEFLTMLRYLQADPASSSILSTTREHEHTRVDQVQSHPCQRNHPQLSNSISRTTAASPRCLPRLRYLSNIL